MSNSTRGQYTFAEILNQPNAWAETIQLVDARASALSALIDGVDEVVFTGCGSGLNASRAAAPAFQHFTGIRARAVPAAEVVYFGDSVLARQGASLVVLVSRSGETTETVMAGEVARARGFKTLAITCYPRSSMAQAATQSLALEAANEQSVTTTQSLTSMVLCGQLLAGVVAGHHEYLEQLRRLPELGGQVIEQYQDLGRRIAEDDRITRFAFVGSGPYYGLARESQLKVKEMVLLPSDAYPVLDYRHGPKSNVDEHMLVTLLMSDSARRVESEFLHEMKGLGGNLFVVCDQAGPEVEACADYLAAVGSGLPEFVRDILYMPPIHFLAYYKSMLRGQDPDNPANLTYWVETARS
jgi:glucosamine--fructose-6-phosphate aminotransferase (isomerizing)